MYELIMDFPLFKGISREQVSELVEKNCVLFESRKAGESIVKSGEVCSQIRFIVKGKARMTTCSPERKIAISQTIEKGAVVGADSLFGWNTCYVSDVYAITDLSSLVFNKEQYIKLLKLNDIYLLNYLNYLSLNVHMARYSVREYPSNTVSGLIGRWLLTATRQSGANIMIHITMSDLVKITGIREDLVEKEISELELRELVSFNQLQGHLKINSRSDFLEFMENR